MVFRDLYSYEANEHYFSSEIILEGYDSDVILHLLTFRHWDLRVSVIFSFDNRHINTQMHTQTYAKHITMQTEA